MGSKNTVYIREIPIGGGNPVTVQSMTNTDTADVESTVKQIIALENEGCDIVRMSVYNEKCAKAISSIKEKTHIPLVADIHFDYKLAIMAMENGIDKIRFNPGNIGSEMNVKELVACAKDKHIPIRIGVNSGSVEKEYIEQYGGVTSEGMIKSALKHVQILEKCGFYDIVISIKASNVLDTIDVYTNLSKFVDYPLHLGVTEAGAGNSGLIKSSIGIGNLLLNGIGDTIRVSLTGDPVQEVTAGNLILRSIGMRKRGIDITSCPTCGRTNVDLEKIVKYVEERIPKTNKYLKASIMGCAVNGPGEAREADIGIAFGKTNAVVFKNGEKCYSGELPQVIDSFIDDINDMIK